MKEKVVLAYSGGLDTTTLSASASTLDRETSLTVWKKEQNTAALPNYISNTLLMNSATIISLRA